MADEKLRDVWRYVRGRKCLAGSPALTDLQLLRRFAEQRDEAAFAALIERHGVMVRTVCRRILRDEAAIDDVFQATFLVLACKCRRTGWHESLASWLWAVAYRVACKAKVSARRRERHEQQVPARAAPAPEDPAVQAELREAVDDEVARLPEKYRLPLLLCYFEGQTNEEAAAQLCWPIGTLAGRLSRARDLLRRRLSSRGLVLTTGVLATALAAETASASMAAPLAIATSKAACLFAAGQPGAAGVSSSVVCLVQGVTKAMGYAKLNAVVMTLVLVGLSLGAGWGVYQVTLNMVPSQSTLMTNEEEFEPVEDAAVRKVSLNEGWHWSVDGEGPMVFTSMDETIKGLSKAKYDEPNDEASIRKLAAQVDFRKEKLLRVRWNNHRAGKLRHHTAWSESAPTVTTFYCQAPRPELELGLGLPILIEEDFFAVPSNRRVDYDINPHLNPLLQRRGNGTHQLTTSPVTIPEQ
jgi:RNA polymerase sigma factor (sigma-70 family)